MLPIRDLEAVLSTKGIGLKERENNFVGRNCSALLYVLAGFLVGLFLWLVCMTAIWYNVIMAKNYLCLFFWQGRLLEIVNDL